MAGQVAISGPTWLIGGFGTARRYIVTDLLISQESAELRFGMPADTRTEPLETGIEETQTKSPRISAAWKSYMQAAGFRPYAKEWWHFELVDEPFKRDGFDFEVSAVPSSNKRPAD
jgi:hypothetical protein